MREIILEEAKKIEFDILKNIADFCEKNNLRYFLAYGTLIGAVRHSGFIPWDDDIDIWMPREYYNRFKEIYYDENNVYKVVKPQDKISRHSFVKVIDTRTAKIEKSIDYKNGYLGIDVDVFPLDGQPLTESDYLEWYNKLQKIYKRYQFLVIDNKGSLKRNVFLPIIKCLVGKKIWLLKKAELLHKEYSYAESEYIGTVESVYNSKNNRYKKEWFDKTVDVSFEGYSFKAPAGYDGILTAMYGDYMKLPPVEKQKIHHENNTFWLEN